MEKHNDNWIGWFLGILGGSTKWLLTIELNFWVKITEAACIAFICGLAGVAGKELWYCIKRKLKK